MAGFNLRERIENSRDLPARMALRVTNTRPVSRLLAGRYDRARASHSAALPVLGDADRHIVAGIERDGVFITSLEALGIPGSAGLLNLAQQLAAGFADSAHAQVRGGRDFTIVPPADIAARPEIFAWGLDDRLLDIAEAYLQLPVAYDGINIIYTIADGRPVATRQWHRDWEDRRMLKIAIYLNDVGPQGGPFQLLARDEREQSDASGYRYAPASHAELGEMFGADYERDVVSCEGPAGTVIFTDTARYFHRGQPAIAQDRAAMFYSYFARTPRHPFYCERSGLSREQIAALSADLPPRQRACARWREALPAPVRLIPPAGL